MAAYVPAMDRRSAPSSISDREFTVKDVGWDVGVFVNNICENANDIVAVAATSSTDPELGLDDDCNRLDPLRVARRDVLPEDWAAFDRVALLRVQLHVVDMPV